jgi:competence protein ComGC
MSKNRRRFSIYTIISIIAFAGLIFVLLIPRFYNIREKEKTELCIENMQKIKKAIEEYMADRHQSFNGDMVELVRTGYLKYAYECPENGVGDKYIASGNYETGEIIVKCPNEKEFPMHKLP